MRATDCRTRVEQLSVVRLWDGGIGDFVHIAGDDGTTGIFGPVDCAVALFVLGVLAPVVIGERISPPEALWLLMKRAHRHTTTGLAIVAMSAVDCALWDLRGKLVGRPVFELLGEPVRATVPVYASLLGPDKALTTLVHRAMSALERGFAGVKLGLARAGGTGDEQSLAANVAVVRTLRKAIGDGPPLMVDALGGWTFEYARQWCASAKGLELAWLEEPLPAGDLSGLAQLTRTTAIPISAGEHAYTLSEAQALLSLAGVAVLQSDMSWCGLTEGMRVAVACAERGVPLCPHGAGIVPAVHLAAVYPVRDVPVLEYHVALEPTRQRWFTHPLTPVNGRVELPNRPGLGIELREDLLKSAQIASRPEQLCDRG